MKERFALGRPNLESLRHWTEIALALIAVVCLSAWTWSYLDSHLFQAYESWRFSRALAAGPAASAPAPTRMRQLPEDNSAAAGAPVASPAKPASPGPARSPRPATPAISEGEPLGRLEVSRLGLSVMVAQGVSGRTLRRSVGHIPATALPGEPGNIGIAGHRDTFFRPLKDIRKNDTITLATLQGTYRYVVDSTAIVGPDDIQVLDPTGRPTLTLVTCYPFYYVGAAPQRFVVQAHLAS
jgi:sortase A